MFKCLFKTQSECNKKPNPKKNDISHNINTDNINSNKSDSNTNMNKNNNNNTGYSHTDDEDEAMLSINNSNRSHYITQSTTMSASQESLTISPNLESLSPVPSTTSISRTISPSFGSTKSSKSTKSTKSTKSASRRSHLSSTSCSSTSRRSSIRSYDIRPDNYLTSNNLNVKNVAKKQLKTPPKHRYNQIIIVHKRNKDRMIYPNNLNQSISMTSSQSVPSSSTYCTNKENICICNHESEPLSPSVHPHQVHSNYSYQYDDDILESEIEMKSNHSKPKYKKHGNNTYHEATYYNHNSQPHYEFEISSTPFSSNHETDSYQHHYELSQYEQHSQSQYDQQYLRQKNKNKKYKYINVIHENCACCPDCIQYVVPPKTNRHGNYQNHNKYNYYYSDMDNYNQSICDEDGFYDYNYNYRPNGISIHNPFRHNVDTINGLTVIQE